MRRQKSKMKLVVYVMNDVSLLDDFLRQLNDKQCQRSDHYQEFGNGEKVV